MTATPSERAARMLAQAQTHWGSGPDAGPTIALIGVGLALLAIHDLLEERLVKPTDWQGFAQAIVADEPWEGPR